MTTGIFVLGMHRNGTSMVAGLLRILGVDFGPDSDLMAPNQFNIKGFFEHVAMNGINVEVLQKFGGEWYAPPSLPAGWENSDRLSDCRRRAEERIRAFGKPEFWGFKDPRTCITFPFWKKVMRDLKDPIKVVIVGRNPSDASRSLQNSQKVLASEASELWFKHMVSAVVSSAGIPRHVVFYEDFMKDIRGEFLRMAAFLQKLVPPQALGQAERFMEGGMYHYASDPSDVHALSDKVKKAYLTMRAFVDVGRQGRLEPSDELRIGQILAGL